MDETHGLLLRVPFAEALEALRAGGNASGFLDPAGSAPVFEDDGARKGARFFRDTCARYVMAGNFNRTEGTVMLWFKPAWASNFEDSLGRILWDVRIEHGSLVENDPSQRWALVYANPAAGKVRDAATVGRWRFCVETNRNLYIIGTKERRPDPRTRQAVFSSRQHFRAGVWVHLAVTWNATTGAVWIDGRKDAEAPLPEGLPTRPLPETLQIGAIPTWMNAGADGVVSDFRIYGVWCDAQRIGAAMRG